MRIAFISHPDCLLHDMGGGHPESPERLESIRSHIAASDLPASLEFYEAPPATFEQLERVHPQSHIQMLQDSAPVQGLVYLDPDTAMNPWTWSSALHAAGAGVLATDIVAGGRASAAFCSIRPPGHHALSARAMGFCFFNNIAIAVRHAQAVHGIRRVAIIDFDVHHGNGTEEIFSNDENVLMVSIFQHPFYPGSGTRNPAANMVNVPLPAGADGDALADAVTGHWIPALEKFEPEMLFISAGFDAHREDVMAQLRFVEADYSWVTRQMKIIADKYAQGRIVSMLEGGYALPALGRSVVAHLAALKDEI